ncbi:ABC-three component system protein [Streptomyces sp. NPDC047985]|uniref:ABC-three component system protein n=1 Tax=Streptomyces sp. NPDC047985 TaxID=3155384 RepID=UPI00342EBB7A
MLPHQMQYAQSKFRSLIEGSFGNEFEKLFHRVMELRHEDYVPIRTAGSIGDLGGDGLRTVGRRLYACYAPETFNVSEVRGKFRSDVESAIIQRPEQFDIFVFVHNDQRGGIHPVISGLLMEAGKDHPRIAFQQMGPQKIWHEAMFLDRLRMEHLLGEAIPVELVAYRIGMAEIEPLLKHLADHRQHDASTGDVPLPTTHKVEYNELSPQARQVLQAGRPYGYLVEQYYREGLDLRERDEVADSFRAYYRRMRNEHGDDADEILWQMQRYVLGQEAARWEREEAAKAVLAYFFDECDIFEVPPPGWQPSIDVEGGAA